MGLFAAQILLKEARAQQRFSLFDSGLLVITLAMVAAGDIFSSGSTAWVGASAASGRRRVSVATL